MCKIVILSISVGCVAIAKAQCDLPTTLHDKLPEIQRIVGDSKEVKWFNSGFGNKDYLFIAKGEKPGFYRLTDAEVRYPREIPYGWGDQMKNGGSKIQTFKNGNCWAFGNNKFAVVLREDGVKDLVAFSQKATLSDLCRFTQRIYDEILSNQIRNSHEIPQAYLDLVELCIEAPIAKINTVCAMFAAGISYGRNEDVIRIMNIYATQINKEKNKATGAAIAGALSPYVASLGAYVGGKISGDKKYYENEAVTPPLLFRECALAPAPYICDDLFQWSDSSLTLMSHLCVNQLILADKVSECPAFRYGVIFSICRRDYILGMLRAIRSNGAVDIRKSGYELAEVDLSLCEDLSDWWSDINRKEYLVSAGQLMKINREILVAVREKLYERGFEELSLLADKWRPVMRKHVRNYHYLFSDLPVVVSCQRAFAIQRDADAFFGYWKDRPRATGAAHQWMRFCADGEACRYVRSNYSANLIEQYHGSLKKMLGEQDYKTLETTLKISYKREDEEFPSRLK